MKHLKQILTSEQTREADKQVIDSQSISSLELMERASTVFIDSIKDEISKSDKICICCGTGNNGGDGLAVSRILQSEGYQVATFLIKINDNLSKDCQANFDRLENVKIINSKEDLPHFAEIDIIIDAIFGSGLTRPIEGLAAEVVQAINFSKKKVLSIDVPSGMYADKLSDSEIIVKSYLTVSFQRPKLSFFFPENSIYLNKWMVADIGLDENYIQSLSSSYFLLDKSIENWAKSRQRFSHKGTYGHALIIAGSYGKMGAAVLASKACLRSGVGLISTYVPKVGYNIMQTSIPEAMCLTDECEHFITRIPSISIYNAIGIGPGIGQNPESKEALELLLKNANQPLVIDADAINILAGDEKLKKLIPDNSVLTPHPKELERLVGSWKNSEERLQKQIEFAKKHTCIVVLKDAYTSICDTNGNIYFNTSGNAGMATGGSGDVLTGIITGLLAQSYDPLFAALIGVYFHGKAGDDAAKIKGQNALIASDIIEHLRIGE
ncbi:NAD(P)H-hydrate dehydratase [Arcticibacterium luteifluviistationis]|uniref:NAD(P)H-hydrate dehydratase n=1 Tax=Arcticibacterium luteifluviistationis TaxID=1784714 RepID=UPI0013A6D242|nr:NAD(P)H-hydrate dehydratase [Arcticibacterium luteifluviistationis]